MRFAAFEIGPGNTATLKRLWKKSEENEIDFVCTDGNYSYSDIVSQNADIKHIVSKSETCLVESYNSVLRHYLARLQRKTKCYSKSAEMLRISVMLLINKKLALSL